jgi:hypothetical protein
MDPVLIRRLFGVDEFGGMLALHRAGSLAEYLTPDKRKGSDLTPVPLPPGWRLAAWIHSPRLGEILKKKYDELRLECRFHYRADAAPEAAEVGSCAKRSRFATLDNA